MPDESGGLHDEVGYWLRRLADEVQTNLDRRLRARGITVAQWNVLITVHRSDATTTSEVARYVAVDPGAISRVVDRLVDKGLMARREDPASRRRTRLELTPAGQRLMPALVAIADENEATYFGSLAPRARAGLVRLLRRLLAGTMGRSARRSE